MLKIPRHVWATSLQVLALTCLLSLHYLLHDNMGSENEQDVLPIARQAVDPTWVAGDWYLNQPSGYRLLFNFLVGHLAVQWGFLGTSIVGRLVCYLLVAMGLILICRAIGLTWQFTLIGIGVLLYFNPNQSMAAEEWFVGALEAKSVAYGFVLLAIGLLLTGRYRWMALMLGLATSFHVVVGGWTFLTVLVWFACYWRQHSKSLKQIGQLLLIYGLARVCKIVCVKGQNKI